MENKKQLIIVPPMSEHLKKLHTVLLGIANDENIDLSLIDESKEFSQFLDSSNQSLIIFSDAKKCIMFLQENRLAYAKNHSKTILLTPTEMPTKTLLKFIKLGLTEAILESSPPKTLLYKVKLILRSLKNNNAVEEKDQVVKSMLDLNKALSNKEQMNEKTTKENGNEDTANQLYDDKAKKIKDKTETKADSFGNLKGKNSYQENAIETNWKSKIKDEEKSLNFSNDEVSLEKIKGEDPNNMDMYYRKDAKKNNLASLELDSSSNENANKKSEQYDQQGNNLSLKKIENESSLVLEEGAAKNKKNNYAEEESNVLSLKKSQKTLDLIDDADLSSKKDKTTDDDEDEKKEKRKKKGLTELDKMVEAAKKRKIQETEEIAGYTKGSINNSKLEFEDDNEDKKEKKNQSDEGDEETLSNKFQRKKNTDLEFTEEESERKKRATEEEDSENDKKAHNGKVDLISTELTGKNGKVDKLTTLDTGDMTEDKSKKLSTLNITKTDLNNKKEKQPEEESEESSNLKHKNNETNLNFEAADKSRKKENDSTNENDEDQYNKKEFSLEMQLETGEDDQKEATTDGNNTEGEQGIDHAKSTNLTLLDGEKEKSKSASEEQESEIALKKINQTTLEFEKEEKKHSHDGKVDQIDTFYRGGKAKNIEYSWDDLNSTTVSEENAAAKKKRREEEIKLALIKKDAGEMTIDYRKMKEEFDNISHGRSTDEEFSASSKHHDNLSDSDDAGSFKVIEVDSRGFEFGIDIVNLIYQKDSKSIDFFKLVSKELITQYNAYPVFYTYKVSDKKHLESFDSFLHFEDALVAIDLKEWWINTKTEQEILNYYFDKTMTTWLCRAIPHKSGDGTFWEDVELPSWAAQELQNKKVELIYPYFDGIDRMGMAILIFPNGVNSSKEHSIMVTLETIRTIFLDSIQRAYSTVNIKSQEAEEPVETKKNILSMFSGLFGRNKAS